MQCEFLYLATKHDINIVFYNCLMSKMHYGIVPVICNSVGFSIVFDLYCTCCIINDDDSKIKFEGIMNVNVVVCENRY